MGTLFVCLCLSSIFFNYILIIRYNVRYIFSTRVWTLHSTHHIFSPFFSLPNVFLYIFCYPFPPSLMKPIVGNKIFCKFFLNSIFPPLSFFLFNFFFIFTPLVYQYQSHFSPQALAGIFVLPPPPQGGVGVNTKMYNIDPFYTQRRVSV